MCKQQAYFKGGTPARMTAARLAKPLMAAAALASPSFGPDKVAAFAPEARNLICVWAGADLSPHRRALVA